jgi:hypothetical protein
MPSDSHEILPVEALPVAGNRLFHAEQDHLGDVPARQRDALPCEPQRAALVPHLSRERLEFLSAGDERRQLESESEAHLAIHPAPRVALAVGAVAADHDAGFHERREMPPERRWRDAMGAGAKLLVRGEDDQRITGCECRLLVE